MLRQLAKVSLARAVSGTGAHRLVGALSGARGLPLVLGYHRVVEHFDAAARGALAGMVVSAGMLERHLDWLGRRYDLVSLDELGARLTAPHGSHVRPAAAVTFDDGYADVLEHALPVLRRKGIPAAVFVVTECVANGTLPLYDRLHVLLTRDRHATRDIPGLLLRLGRPLPVRLAKDGLPAQPLAALRALLDVLPRSGLLELVAALDPEGAVDARAFPELRPLTWGEVRTLQRAGMTIGSHTRTHALLNREDKHVVEAEVAGSRMELERTLGTPVRHFAYPDGRYDDAALEAVAAAGYRFAYTTCTHRDPRHPLLTIPRRMFWETSCVDTRGRFCGAVMDGQAAGLFDRATTCAHGPARAALAG